MKKTITATVAALFLTTSLVGPARADNDLLRLGIGVGAALLGEAMKGGNRRQAQPRRSEGKQSNRQTRSRGTATGAAVATAGAAGAVAFVLPEGDAIPSPLPRPTEEEMTAWLASEENREQAEAEAALAPIDETTTAATAAEDGEKVELFDNENQSWGFVSKSERERAFKFAALGMNLADSYRAIGLTGPVATAADDEGIDLIDEQGRLWGNVPDAVADKVWKAVDLGMKPSAAFAALSGLKAPDDKAKTEEAPKVAAQSEDDKMLAWCLEPLRMAVPMTECRPYKAQQEAKRQANIDAVKEEKRLADLEAKGAGVADAARADAARTAKAEADKAAFAAIVSEQEDRPAVADVEPTRTAPIVDSASTAAVVAPAKIEPAAEQPQAAPVEKAKPKLKLDL